MKFTWARSESTKWLHETGTRLQISTNVFTWNMQEVPIFLLWSASLCRSLLNAALLIIIIFFRLFPVILHLGMVQQHSYACSQQWSLTGLKSVRVYMVPWSDFRQVRVIRVGSATGMTEIGMRWFFRPASCKQKQAFVWRPIWSCTGLSFRTGLM